ncbi:MAG TPA: hypothetical protein VIX37_01410, partial [Candidatus Sulfotelmatobacter sp.]
QDGLNLELNSWSPRSILCFLVNCRVIEPLEISYFFVGGGFGEKHAAVAGAVGKVEIRGVGGFPSAVGNSAFWSFPRSGFFHSSFTH